MHKELTKRIISSLVLLPLLIYSILNGSYFFFILIFICFSISIYEWQKMKLPNLIKIIGIIFLFCSFYSMLEIRTFYDDNYLLFLIISFICIFTDIGGYIFGKIFKGPKLTKLSPNKTFAGMFGSYILSFLLFLLIIKFELINKNYFNNLLIFVFLISSVSQSGDIIVSYFKRISKIKDTGKIIPGHGGLLDRIDGMIFAFPISYLALSFDYFNIIL